MKNLKQDKLYQRVYDEIRNYIVANNLKSGDKLPSEAELCETLGVSRNVVREALKALQLMGFVNPVPAVGYIIEDFSFDRIYENILYHIIPATSKIEADMISTRAALEIAYFDEAFYSLTDYDLTELEKTAKQIVSIVSSGKRNLKEFIDAERTFHHLIYQHIDNEMFHSIFNVTWEIVERMRFQKAATDPNDLRPLFEIPNYSEENDEHMLLYKALAIRDYELAKKLTKEHFSKFIRS
jgi:DNA-binding FadR family transcriptional regulator